MPNFAKRINGLRVAESNYHNSPMDSLAIDSRFIAQVRGQFPHDGSIHRRSNGPVEDIVKGTVLSMLGTDFPLQWEHFCSHQQNHKDPVIFSLLSKLFPMSEQGSFFWQKFAKPFANMLETASFPLDVQCRFLTFVYARVIGMMGPHDTNRGSFMTFDGSPVELSWIVPNSGASQKGVDRQIRFAIEPIDPRNGQQLCGGDVLDYLVSPLGSLGIVKSQDDAMAWSKTLEKFLFPDAVESQIPEGSKFFVGFDFSSSGHITLKAYYIPAPRAPLATININPRQRPIQLWDSDWNRLRTLMPSLNPSLVAPLDRLISFINNLDEPYRPRIEIFSVDCVASSVNRLKIYCRPKEGASWADACRTLTLGGTISSSSMTDALAHLEILWNQLFPCYGSTTGRQLELSASSDIRNKGRLSKRNVQHPTGGLLYYFSLHPGMDIPLPKIYLPVSRYCRNDLQICNAVEQVYGAEGKDVPNGWVSREVSKVFDHRALKAHKGIHTYVTLAYKGKGWEVTSYFSPELWS